MKIPLHVADQKAYVWDISDLQSLRSLRVCGVLEGTLPQLGQQNIFLGVPLVLMPEEVNLLVSKELAYLIDDPSAHIPATTEQVNTYNEIRAEAIKIQRLEHLKNEKEKAIKMSTVFRKEIEKKRAEREKERGKVDEDEGDKEERDRKEKGERIEKEKPLDSIPFTVQIEASSTGLPWFDSTSHEYHTLASAKAASVWNYPTTPLQTSKCKVFQDLWEKGFYMGGGLRFGGDFLVYPGDPLRYHSHFTLTVLPSPDTPILPLDIVAYGRLATAVKKAHLLGTWDGEKAIYQTIEWAAFG